MSLPKLFCSSSLLLLLLASGPASACWTEDQPVQNSDRHDSQAHGGFDVAPLERLLSHVTQRDTSSDRYPGEETYRRWHNDAQHHVVWDFLSYGRHHDRYGFDDDRQDNGHDQLAWWKAHHGSACDEDSPPHETPLPAAALLFAPGILMLRVFQRRAA